MPGLFQFPFPDFQLQFQQVQGGVGRAFQYFFYAYKKWLVVIDNTCIGRKRNFAIGKCIKCINGFIRRNAGRQMYQNFHVFSGVVVNFFDFYFPFVVGFNNCFNERGSCFTERNFSNGQRFIIALFDFGPDFY